ncbi:phage tail protein [Lysinibacillus xylanilyticus]|uniref:phage tail protein n=1 Tax=Lysinibacillus xylanilyticus TaxID=582475 RepID=UPI003D03D950
MLIVTNGNQIEPLIQFNNFQMEQEIKGNFTISFNTFNVNNNPAYRILQEESIITVEGHDFRVKQMKETRNAKQITAINTFFDLIDTRKNEIFGGTRTFEQFASFCLDGTPWRFTSDVSGSRLIENFGDNNVIALVTALCQVYECEYVIMPNNRIHFAKEVGPDNDAQYRYGYNVKALSKNVDTTGLKTYIEGYGAASEGGGQLFVSYESPYASKYGKREANPVHDDRFTNGQALVDHIKGMLTDFPEVTFELDSIELTNKELGERVWLIYEPMGMEFQTRILSQTKGFVNGQFITTKVVLGNSVPRSTSDILISQKVEIDENKKITRSKFEQTNDRITMEVEEVGQSIAQLDIKADQINSSVNNRITNEVSTINQRADNIQLEVNNNKQQIARIDIKADSISQTVTNNKAELDALDGRVGTAESEISQNAYQISLKVSQTDFNGNTIVNKINLDSGGVQIYGRKIDLYGAVNVLSEITGELGVINTGTLNSVNINSARIDIRDDVKIGRNLTLQGSGANRIIFSDMTSITSDGAGSVLIDLYNDLTIQALTTTFWGNVNFSNAQVTGLRGVYFNGSNRCYLKDERGRDICYWAATPA